MVSVKNIHTAVSTQNVNTITVDIFDTILMRKVWPEGLQFLEVAKRSVSIFQNSIDPSITAYELYSWREYIREEILTAKRQDAYAHNDVDLTLEEWFSELYCVLSAKYTATPKTIPKKVLDELIAVELAVEKEYTAPNLELIGTLRQEKADNPALKLFFVSDMYLTAKQVNELLDYHGIQDVFDGGITSVDAGNAKHSGRLFHYLQVSGGMFSGFTAANNLHIGDSYHSDVAMARSAGNFALHYNPRRLRRLRTLAGRVQLKLIKLKAYRQEKSSYKKALRASRDLKDNSQLNMHDLGFLFAQPMASYLLHVGMQSKLTPEKHYIFVSSEASTFIEAGKKLFGELYSKPEAAVRLNRKRTIHAVSWKIIQNTDERLMPKLIKTVRYGEMTDSRKELYDFLLTDKFPVNEAEINSMRKKEFYRKLYHDLQNADPTYTKHLEDDYRYVASTLPSDNRTVVICDVGWGGTIQAAYTIFAELHGYKGKIEGLYLGTHPPTRFGIGDLPMIGYLLPNVLSRKYRAYWSAVIWEYVYTNKFQFDGDEERLKFVGQGLRNGYDHFRSVHVSPVEYFHKVVSKEIKRLLQHPTDSEVAALGEIRYDFGFNDPQILQIVDTKTPRWQFWTLLFTKPKTTLGVIIAPNNWTGGYIKRYRLIGIPTLLRILGRLKRTNYL